MSYLINNIEFKLKALSLREDEKLAKIINKVFGLQQDEDNRQHKKNMSSGAEFIQTQFLDDRIIVTGGFLSKLLESNSATTIAEMFLEPVDHKPVGAIWYIKKFRLYWLSKHIKGDLKGKLFTDFFSEGTVYAANLVTYFLILLNNRITQLNELNQKKQD